MKKYKFVELTSDILAQAAGSSFFNIPCPDCKVVSEIPREISDSYNCPVCGCWIKAEARCCF